MLALLKANEVHIPKQIVFKNLDEVNRCRNKIIQNSEKTMGNINQTFIDQDSMAAFKLIRFMRCGMDPLFEHEQNFIEQVYQTFNYLVCLDAVKILMIKHEGVHFKVTFGAQSEFDIVSLDQTIICEYFAIKIADSNKKLRRKSERVSLDENAMYRYVIYYSDQDVTSYVNQIKADYTNVSIIRLKEI